MERPQALNRHAKGAAQRLAEAKKVLCKSQTYTGLIAVHESVHKATCHPLRFMSALGGNAHIGRTH
jgi:hypothetical protein